MIYRQVLTLDDSICLVGSKMYMYKLMEEQNYHETEAVVDVGLLGKELLVATNKCVRFYDIGNGSLKSVVKVIFGEFQQSSSAIYSAFCLESK
jgi:hypothetical protein